MFHFMVCKRACGEPQGSVLGQLSSSSDLLIILNLGLGRSQTVFSKI